MKILVIGYGSIGKRHSKNIVSLGLKPYVLTKYPDNNKNIIFIKDYKEAEDYEYAIIGNATALHSEAFINIINNTDCKNILLENLLIFQ